MKSPAQPKVFPPLWLIVPLASLGFFSCSSGLDRTASEGREISNLQIQRIGPDSVDEARLRNLIRSQPGTTCTEERLSEDLKSLYESGLVDDVRFVAKPDGEKIRLIAEISTRPPLDSSAIIVGNTKFTDTRLWKVSGVSGTKSLWMLSDTKREAACSKLEKFYHNEGYQNTKVSIRDSGYGRPAARGDSIFVIEEGALKQP